MANERDQVLMLIDRAAAQMMRREDELAREVVQAYEQARRDLVAEFMDTVAALGDDPTVAQIRRLANDAALIGAIEARLEQLQLEFAQLMHDGIDATAEATFQLALREIQILAVGAGIRFFPFAVDPLLELTIGPAIDQIPDVVASLRANILTQLRESLAAGDRISDISRAVLGRNNSVFRNGVTSAELMVRRAVIQAENNARLLFYEESKSQLPGLQKQAVAVISSRTTKVCLDVHGQIQPLDKPFEISGTPSFGKRQMQSPFHWNCRTRIAPYLEAFEERSTMTTAAMRQEAQAALADRK